HYSSGPVPEQGRALRGGVAGLVFAVVAIAVIVSARGVGVAWAENDYLDHLDAITRWAHEAWALGPGAVTRLTGPYGADTRYLNPPPPLYKYLALLTRSALPGLG